MIPFLLPLRKQLRVLALGAHCDDIELGMGGTILNLFGWAPGLELVAFVATSTPQREAECRGALHSLAGPANISVVIRNLPDTRLPTHYDEVKDHLGDFAQEQWDVVLSPHADDAHQDHAILGRLAPTSFRDHLIMYYELPKWDGDLGRLHPNAYVPLSAEQVQRKWEVLDKHYVSQRSHHWWDQETISGLARLRGIECRSRYAEAFRIDKMVLGPMAAAKP